MQGFINLFFVQVIIFVDKAVSETRGLSNGGGEFVGKYLELPQLDKRFEVILGGWVVKFCNDMIAVCLSYGQ